MEEWKTYRLGELVNILDSQRIPLSSSQRASKRGKIPYWGAQGIIDYIDDFIFDGRYLLIAEDGENLNSRKQPIANFASGKFWVNNHAHIVESNGKCDIDYIYYWLNLSDLSAYITGSAQPKLNQYNLSVIELKLPSIEKQKIVSRVLKSLDDKIELNRKINDNLEESAQELFNYYLFHNRQNMGDYKSGVLTDIATYTNGLAMQKYPPVSSEHSMPVLKIKELGQGYCDDNSDKCSTAIRSNCIVNNGDVIFSWSGTLMVKIWCGERCGLNQHLFKVTSDIYPKWFNYFWTKHHLKRFIRVAQDKAVTMGHIKRCELETSEVIIPNTPMLRLIDSKISPILNQMINLQVENNRLESIRDSLLPKLMSGELKINDLTE